MNFNYNLTLSFTFRGFPIPSTAAQKNVYGEYVHTLTESTPKS